jgi:hypothetical protein
MMESALHITTNVLPGNRIEVQLPEGSEGQKVDLFIVLQTPSPAPDTQTINRQLQQSTAALARIRSRPRVDPQDFGLPDSTDLIREDRDR